MRGARPDLVTKSPCLTGPLRRRLWERRRMPTANRHRITTRAAAIVASVIVHAGLLTALLLYRPVLIVPEEPGGPPQAIIPILLLPRALPAAAGGAPQGEVRLHRRAQRFTLVPPQVAPVLTAAVPAAPGSDKAAPAITPPSPPAAGGQAADLRAALRNGALGCINLGSLSRAERDLCDERLGKAAAGQAYIPAPIDPRKRAYYDAVAAAKKPDRQPVPQVATGSLGMFDTDPRGVSGHPPGIGCRIPFGPGKKPELPSHWLSLGPCYIAPPQGPLTVEADITPP